MQNARFCASGHSDNLHNHLVHMIFRRFSAGALFRKAGISGHFRFPKKSPDRHSAGRPTPVKHVEWAVHAHYRFRRGPRRFSMIFHDFDASVLIRGCSKSNQSLGHPPGFSMCARGWVSH